MRWTSRFFLCLRFAASRRTRRQGISGWASPCLPGSGFRLSSLDAGACTTKLTWTRGSKNISAEGGPERKLYGP